jgi:phosphate starvation-inducible membrane PsiE
MIFLKIFLLLLMFFVANCCVKKTVNGEVTDMSHNGTVQIVRFFIFIGLGALIIIL